MKKILIVNNNMKVGGVQKSLYNLLWSIYERYDVTLCLFRAEGEYIEKLPPNVKVVECKYLVRFLGMSQGECRGIEKLGRGSLAALARVFGRASAMRVILAGQPVLSETYDCAISFLQNGNVKHFYGGVQEFVLRRVNAHKKIAFLHCDYANCGANHPINNRLIEEFDAIAACSDGCRKVFEETLPACRDKCVTVRNCHRVDEIKELAEKQPVVYDPHCVHVVMVSRLSHEKGIERAIAAVAYAAERELAVQLHIIGGGPKSAELAQTAINLGMDQRVHFYGEQGNPYRYMKNADLFLLTSFHEAAPMVLEEARCLGVPILTVRTTSSEEMVAKSNCGWICENAQQPLNEALTRILEDKEDLSDLKRKLQNSAMDNAQALTQFVQLIEGEYEV